MSGIEKITASLEDLISKIGGGLVYWERNAAFIGDWIKAYNSKHPGDIVSAMTATQVQNSTLGVNITLPAMGSTEVLSAETTMKINMPKMEKTASAKARPILWHGGMKSPHLHYNEQVYQLNEKQWKDYTKEALGRFADKLRTKENVSFDSMMKVSENME
jgi:hypothetical protein